MSTELRLHSYAGGIAGANFSATGTMTGFNNGDGATGQYLFVALNGTEDTFDLYTNNHATSNRRPMGVSQNDPKLNGELSVMLLGRTKIVAGVGGMAIGDEIGADSAGRGVVKRATLTGANLGDWVMGVCVCAAAVGETGAIELIGAYRI